MRFAQYDVVKITGFRIEKHLEANAFDRRAPRVGDIATIIEIYTDPVGYELECSDPNGITEWMIAVGPNEIELELIK